MGWTDCCPRLKTFWKLPNCADCFNTSITAGGLTSPVQCFCSASNTKHLVNAFCAGKLQRFSLPVRESVQYLVQEHFVLLWVIVFHFQMFLARMLTNASPKSSWLFLLVSPWNYIRRLNLPAGLPDTNYQVGVASASSTEELLRYKHNLLQRRTSAYVVSLIVHSLVTWINFFKVSKTPFV